MDINSLVLGIDLGTSGVRIAIVNNQCQQVYFSSNKYQEGLDNCNDWKNCCECLINGIPSEIKTRLIACSIDGTSGTLMGCNYKGEPLGKALPYFTKHFESKSRMKNIFKPHAGFRGMRGNFQYPNGFWGMKCKFHFDP